MKKKILIVSFNPTDSVPKFSKVLEEESEWLKILNSTWLIATYQSAEQLYSKLAPHVDSVKDRIFVTEMVLENYQGWLNRNAWDWIKQIKNLNSQQSD